jgi:hypothetical protein
MVYDVGDGLEIRDRNGPRLIRERGYRVALKSPQQQALDSAFDGIGKSSSLARDRVDAPLRELYMGGLQPESIKENRNYDVAAISAPIFGPHGKPDLALSLSGFRSTITGRKIEQLAAILMQTCSDVMKDSAVIKTD